MIFFWYFSVILNHQVSLLGGHLKKEKIQMRYYRTGKTGGGAGAMPHPPPTFFFLK